MHDERPPRDGGQTGGEAAGHTGVLRETLRAARNLLRKITGDPLLLRLLDVYSRTPTEDREVLVGVLEREVTWRRMSRVNAHATSSDVNLGMSVTHINPNARLYVRVVEPSPDPPYVSREEMMQITLRMARATYLTLRTTEQESDWRAGVRDGLVRLPPKELAAVDWMNRSIRELIDEATSSRAAVANGSDVTSKLG